jgi:demethylmenaquinone methyltransferase/2-methoxy-6-polyprenyl-1,4-benzoquinol methylase
MPSPAEKQDSRLMREMFSAIAPRYDRVTRLLSFGMDRRWKELGFANASLPENALVLDLASGTGDFSSMVRRSVPHGRSVAVDLTEPMLQLARAQSTPEAVCADAQRLPFPGATFDCVFAGYALRNFPSLEKSLGEIHRVTKPGGRLVVLDFFLPPGFMFRRLYLSYLYLNGTFWGLLLHGRPRTYSYIADSLRSFVSLEELLSLLLQMGFTSLDCRPFVQGGIGLVWATKR